MLLRRHSRRSADHVKWFLKEVVDGHSTCFTGSIKKAIEPLVKDFERAIENLLKDFEDEVEKIRKAIIEHWERLIEDLVNPSYTAAAA